MKVVMLGVRKFRVPEGFDECDDAQRNLLLVCGLVPEERRERSFWELVIRSGLGCDVRFWDKLVLSLDQWAMLKDCMKWIFSDRIRKRPYEYLDVGGVRYWAMKDGFDDTDAVEISVAAMYFMKLNDENEPDFGMVEMLMGVFLRPERRDLKEFRLSDEWNGDCREIYNEQRVIERAEIFKGLEFGVKVAFLQWFEAEFTYFIECYKDVFGKGSENDARYDDGRGWMLLLKHVAQKGYFGGIAGVHRTNAHVVWSYLLDDVLDSKIKN
jgi:hypothetical protein